MKNISGNMKRIRKQRGLTQAKLSKKTRLALSTVTGIEQYNYKNISLKTLVSISRALKINPQKLLE